MSRWASFHGAGSWFWLLPGLSFAQPAWAKSARLWHDEQESVSGPYKIWGERPGLAGSDRAACICPFESDQRAAPEMQLVLACARAQLNPAAAGEIVSAAAQPLDWLKAVDLASGHGLSPILSCQVQQHAAAIAPEAVRLSLIERFRAHTIRNLELTRELLEILSVLQKNGVGALAMKGEVLAQQLYSDLSLREFVDLDIIVAPNHGSAVI